MRLHLSERFEHCGIARRHVSGRRSFQAPLDGDALTQAGDRDLDGHTCLVRVVPPVHVESVLFQGDVAPSLSRETGHGSSQGELQSVNYATLSRAVGTTDGVILPGEVQGQIADASKLLDRYGVDPNHGSDSSPRTADFSARSVKVLSSKRALRSRATNSTAAPGPPGGGRTFRKT